LDVANRPPALCAPDPVMDRLAATARRDVTGPAGQRVHWVEWGQGPPLVMLHGAYGGWAHFVRNIDAFTADHRVLIPDLPGCGLSDPPPEISVAAVGRGVAVGLDELLGDASYRVLAFSLGGAILGRLRVEHPGRQSHIMLVAPGGIATPRAPAMKAVRHLTGDDLVEAIRFNLNSIMFADPATICPQALRIQYEGSTLARLNVARLDWGPRLGEIMPGYDGEMAAVWGDADVFPQVEELPERPNLIRSWCPQADCHMLPGVGHWAQYEAAEEVNAILRRLLDR
jgi:pimeloyl-ACP methyl ester carboxylesterase